MAEAKTQQLVALTTIVLTLKPGTPGDANAGIPPQPPEIREVPMGAQFKASNAEEQEQLINLGAARVVEEAEAVDEADLLDLTPMPEVDGSTEDGRRQLLNRTYSELSGKAPDTRWSLATLQKKVDELRGSVTEPVGTQGAGEV